MTAFTLSQAQAIHATGNVLVMAGAGAGKTRTLVERCVARVLALEDPVSLDHVLLVTFTEAAAGEMRKRIRERLTEELAKNPANAWLAEQAALLDSARISTLHSFCLQLVREHFHELAIDPQLTVLDETQANILVQETLDEILQTHYAGALPESEAVRQLILSHGGGSDVTIRLLVQRIHNYTQTLPDPALWHAQQEALFARTDPERWLEWLLDTIQGWREDWLAAMAPLAATNPNAEQCRLSLYALPHPASRQEATLMLEGVLAADGGWPPKQKTLFRTPLARLFSEAAFLRSLAWRPPREEATAASIDPLAEDWCWVRPHMNALLGLAREFSTRYAEAKRELGVVDFHDLEQFALQLLWDKGPNQPSAIALHWREKLRHVFVDEYQDINAAQDRIIQAVSRDGAFANRFLVGDVKQSIYRFRLADPRIFQAYAAAWKMDSARGQTIPLSENFRSHEGVLHFVNALFEPLMRAEVGGVSYDEDARLRFGNASGRPHFAGTPGSPPAVELLLHVTSKDEAPAGETAADFHEPSASPNAPARLDPEALMLGLRLRQLKESSFPVWDDAIKAPRPAAWNDMVVLLRSPRAKAAEFARAFSRLGIPLMAARGGLYQATEVTDLLSLLMLLDNPLQDVPILAVLRSPLVGCTLDELAVIRLAHRQGNFWRALQRFHQAAGAPKDGAPPVGVHPAITSATASAWTKVDVFLQRYARWRAMGRQAALSHCIESVLDETRYEDWQLTQERGDERCANVRRFLSLSRQFDQFQRQGLYRFLTFVEAQQEADFDPEHAAPGTNNAVRLMSIHQSKGLEFPIVALAGLGRRFNLDDLRGAIVLDEEYGLCPLVKPPGGGQSWPSLAYWLAARRQKRESLGEELRLLYVAMTRACEKLLLSGVVSRAHAEKRWASGDPGVVSTPTILDATTCLDWLGPLLPKLTGNTGWLDMREGTSSLVAWRLIEPANLAAPLAPDSPAQASPTGMDARIIDQLKTRLEWHYPHDAAIREPAKTSVTALRNRVAEETDAEARPWFHQPPQRRPAPDRASAAEIGTAHHHFQQFVALDRVGCQADIRAEALRLRAEGKLTDQELSLLDIPALAAFWNSSLGARIRQQAPWVRRELQFTARLTPTDLSSLALPVEAGLGSDEYVLIQGAADLVILRPEDCVLVDFKTDHLILEDLENVTTRYRPQLALYALALSRIHARPVSEAWLHFLALNRSVRL